MNPEDDFDSSDIEIPDEALAPSRFLNAGQRSIEAMVNRKVEIRKISKFYEKTLRFGDGAAMTQYSQHLWSNRFDGFRKDLLGEESASHLQSHHSAFDIILIYC